MGPWLSHYEWMCSMWHVAGGQSHCWGVPTNGRKILGNMDKNRWWRMKVGNISHCSTWFNRKCCIRRNAAAAEIIWAKGRDELPSLVRVHPDDRGSQASGWLSADSAEPFKCRIYTRWMDFGFYISCLINQPAESNGFWQSMPYISSFIHICWWWFLWLLRNCIHFSGPLWQVDL